MFKRAVNSVQDNPELLFSNFLFFERMEGSLDTLLTAGDRVRERRSQIRRLEKKYLQKEQDKARAAEGRRPRSGEEKERKKGPAERRKKRQYTEFLEVHTSMQCCWTVYHCQTWSHIATPSISHFVVVIKMEDNKVWLC